jgi:hypothetical protein
VRSAAPQQTVDSEKLREFIEGQGLSFKKNSRSYIFDCPRCRGTQKLYMEQRNGRFKCMKCASVERFQGRAEFALADLALMPLKEVRAFLYGANFSGTAIELDIELSAFFGEDDIIDVDAVDIPTMAFPLTYYPIDHKHSVKGLEYLQGRGIDLAMAQKYHLRFSPEERRVIFPVELGERLVGWQKRTIVPHEVWSDEEEKMLTGAKMLSSKDVPTAHVVMFANNLIGSEHAIVCEGPIDAIKMDLCGGNVATMGKSIGQGQIKTLRDPLRLNREQVGAFSTSGIRKLYLALDPDAIRETARLAREMSDLEVYVVRPPKGAKDMGELTPEEAYQCFLNAEPAGPGKVYIHFGK